MQERQKLMFVLLAASITAEENMYNQSNLVVNGLGKLYGAKSSRAKQKEIRL